MWSFGFHVDPRIKTFEKADPIEISHGPCCMDHPEGYVIMVFFNTGDNLDAT